MIKTYVMINIKICYEKNIYIYMINDSDRETHIVIWYIAS